MTPGLRADCVSYAVQDRVLVSKVELDLRPGEMLAIVGPNGAGKSTLCGILAGDLLPMEGEVEVCGRAVRATKPAALARLRSMLSQHTPLRFPFTAREVALMGRHPHIPRWRPPTETDFALAEYAMRSTQVLHLAERLYPTLSGGEQRRVSLARVIAQDTPVVLLDEPTTALDIGHQQLVMSLCRQLANDGRAVLVVLHDLNLAGAYADRVMVMSEGAVTAVGRPEEVLCADLLSAVFHQQVMVMPHPQTGKPIVLASFEGEATGIPAVERPWRSSLKNEGGEKHECRKDQCHHCSRRERAGLGGAVRQPRPRG